MKIEKKLFDRSNFSGDKIKRIIIDGGIERFRKLLRIGFDPNILDSYEIPPLFHAINFGTPEMIKELINIGADVNFTTSRGFSPWLVAVEHGDIEKIELLAQYPIDTSIHNMLGNHALHYVAMRGDYRLFCYILRHTTKEAVHKTNRWGNTVLHLGVSWGNVNIVRICLRFSGIDVNTRNMHGETPFFQALQKGNMTIVKLLLKAGCDINISDNNNLHPLVVAIKNVPRNEMLTEFVTQLLTHWTDVDVCSDRKETPLWLTAKLNNIDVMKIILQRECNVNHVGKDDLCPIHWAYLNRNMEMMCLLTANGASLNQRIGNQTLLYKAVEDSNSELVKFLLDNGGDLEILSQNDDKRNHPSLARAKKKHDEEIIKLLKQAIATAKDGG